MNEIEIIKNIKHILDSKYIGNDCAYLKNLGIVVTQDSLVEDLHFNRNFITPYQTGYKSVMVNISDIAASGGIPKYITIALSIPENLDEKYIEEFYKGAKYAASLFDVEIIGGDITSSDKIFISVCAIGSTKDRRISSRGNAKIGDKIIVSGTHGSSAAGLRILQNNLKYDEKLIKAHLEPNAEVDFAKQISENINSDYAMMDSSDGLFDALFKIGEMSNVTMSIDFSKIPYNKEIEIFDDYKDLILFGGEDYKIVATVPEKFLNKITNYTVIGEVVPKQNYIIEIKYTDTTEYFDKMSKKIFNHFTR